MAQAARYDPANDIQSRDCIAEKLNVLCLNTAFLQLQMNPVLKNRYYYFDNFEMVLRWAQQRYGDLLLGAERDFIRHFQVLPRASRALLAGRIMRKGALPYRLCVESGLSARRCIASSSYASHSLRGHCFKLSGIEKVGIGHGWLKAVA